MTGLDAEDTPESGAHQGPDRDDERPDATRRRSFVRRHKALTALLTLLGFLGFMVVGGALWVNGKLQQVERVDVTSLPESKRPTRAPGEALNILVAGTDNGDGTSVAEAVRAGDWEPGRHRSDTIMILHIDADRQHAYVISIPRDSYETIYTHQGKPAGKHKINAAFALYGPAGYLATVEHLTGVRMDHLAIVDWEGFKALTDALGGVSLFVPETVHNSASGMTWHKGEHAMNGELALQYVRMRYGLPNGDFDRIRRQQNFLRELMSGLLEEGTLTSPAKLSPVLDAVTRNITVDSEWSSRDLARLSLSLRHLRSRDVTFLSAPLALDWSRSVAGEGDVVILDERETSALWQALSSDTLGEYVATHQRDLLPDEAAVN